MYVCVCVCVCVWCRLICSNGGLYQICGDNNKERNLVCVFVLPDIMLFSDKRFDGSSLALANAQRLLRTVGRISPFPEFYPGPFPNREVLFLLLLRLYTRGVCCYLTGEFISYLAGVFHSYNHASMVVALSDVEILDTIFQRYDDIVPVFHLDDFHFQQENTIAEDIQLYRVTYGDIFDLHISFYGVDSDECDPDSNLDLVYFTWQHFERFAFHKVALVLLPACDILISDDPVTYMQRRIGHLPPLTMHFLHYHRILSDGWLDPYNCDDCVVEYRESIPDLVPCHAPDEACSCNICLRQPPSLRLSALHAINTLIYDLERFELSALTTYDEYVYVVRSGEASNSQILPPEYPEIRVWYHHDFLADSPARFHRHCSGAGPWATFTCSTFPSHDEAIAKLIDYRTHFWCAFCNRGLYFPNQCEDADHE